MAMIRRLIVLLVLLASSVSAQTITYNNQFLRATGVTINSAATDVATFAVPYPKYLVRRVTIYEASTGLGASIATLGVFTGAGGTGTTVVTLATLTTLTAATKYVDSTLAVTADYQTSSSLFVRCGTAHGSAATVSVVVEVQPIL